MWDQNTGRSRGYGFVAYRKKEDAQKALTEMNGEWLGNRAIRCNWANQKVGIGLPEELQRIIAPMPMPMPAPSMPTYSIPAPSNGLDYQTVLAQSPPTNTTVYVGNVTGEITETSMRVMFGEYGLVEEVKLQADKGFAFIRYQTHEQAARAICGIHGRLVGSRPMKLSWGKDNRGAPSSMPTDPYRRY